MWKRWESTSDQASQLAVTDRAANDASTHHKKREYNKAPGAARAAVEGLGELLKRDEARYKLTLLIAPSPLSHADEPAPLLFQLFNQFMFPWKQYSIFPNVKTSRVPIRVARNS